MYAEMSSVEAGLKFKAPSGAIVETTGISMVIEANGVNVHEVEIVEGTGQGYKFLHNLDASEAL